jgi:hypothetical protein
MPPSETCEGSAARATNGRAKVTPAAAATPVCSNRRLEIRSFIALSLPVAICFLKELLFLYGAMMKIPAAGVKENRQWLGQCRANAVISALQRTPTRDGMK